MLKSGKYRKNTEKSPLNPPDSEATCLLALQTPRNSPALLPSQEGGLRGICGEGRLQLLRAPQSCDNRALKRRRADWCCRQDPAISGACPSRLLHTQADARSTGLLSTSQARFPFRESYLGPFHHLVVFKLQILAVQPSFLGLMHPVILKSPSCFLFFVTAI